MATNPAEMNLAPYPPAPLRAEDPAYSDGETTLPTTGQNAWSFEQWLDALARGECDCETLIRGVGDSIDANPEACWELLALVDQYYRRQRIKESDFHNLNLLGQALLIESMPNADPLAPQTAPPASTAPPVARATVGVNDILRNRYRIDAILGRGGMGTVYAATDLYRPDYIPSDQRIALKVLHSEVVRRPGLLTELRAEFQCLQSLSHPNIIRVHEFDQDGDIAFFTMEQLTGAPLSRVLAEQYSKTLHRPYALAIIQQAGAAVAYAHSRGIVHGDLNPANIFITEWGEDGCWILARPTEPPAIKRCWMRAKRRFGSRSPHPPTPAASSLRAGIPRPRTMSMPWRASPMYCWRANIPSRAVTRWPRARHARCRDARQASAPGNGARLGRTQLRFQESTRRHEGLAAAVQPAGRFRCCPSLATLRSARPRPKRVGPPVFTALIALAGGVCWWAQDEYGWLHNTGADAAIKTTATAIQSAVGESRTSVARAAPAVQAPPSTRPCCGACSSPRQFPRHRSSPRMLPPATVDRQTARIELTASAVEVPRLQPVASIPVSRRHNFRGEVSFTWSTESGTAKPGQDFMAVKSRTEYIAAGTPQTRLLVPIVQNPRRHLSRTFYVVVNAPGDGATLGTRTITQVTIPASD